MIEENLGRLAHALAAKGEAESAARFLSSSECLRRQIGSNSTPTVAKTNEETLASIRGQLDDQALAEAWEQGQALTIDEAVALALDS